MDRLVDVASRSVATTTSVPACAGHVEGGSRPGDGGAGTSENRRSITARHRGRVEVSDRDHGHEVGPIPVGIELPEAPVGERRDGLRRADRGAVGVPRPLQQHGQHRVLNTRPRAAAEAPLFDDHAALLVDFAGLKDHQMRPVSRMSSARSIVAVLSVGIWSV